MPKLITSKPFALSPAALGLAIVVSLLLFCAPFSKLVGLGPEPAYAASPRVANTLYAITDGSLLGGDLASEPIVDVQPYNRDLTADDIAALHSANPNIKVVRYVDTVEAINTIANLADKQPWSRDYARRLNTDAEWSDIWANHKSWFLKDSKGRYIHRPSSYPNEFNPQRACLMDPGNAGWRNWLVGKVSQRLSAGYDGVFLDLCTVTPNSGWSGVPAKYVNNSSQWRKDINGLINLIKSKFPKALVITNGIWQGQDYYRYSSANPIDNNKADGIEMEGFIYAKGIGPTETQSQWLNEVRVVKKLGDEGKIVIAHTTLTASSQYSPKGLLAYSLATFLLGRSGTAYFAFYSLKVEAGYDHDYLASVYNLPLGDPIGTYYQAGVSYRRDFTNGKVIVNPNDSGKTYTFTPFPYNHYKDQNGIVVDSTHPLSLPAKSGVILIKSEPPE